MKTIKKKYYAHCFLTVKLLLFFPAIIPAQEIITGQDFFDRVAENYRHINDYTADFDMSIENTLMSGLIYYKNPNLIRIDFVDPKEQVLVSDGKVLQVYIPSYNVTLTQQLKNQINPGGFASGEGLSLLRRNYQIAFKNSPELQPLDNSSTGELVYKLFLTWRNTTEGFREIEISVTPDLYIRRMSAITADKRQVQFTFKDIRSNQNIPHARFEYDSPASSNNFSNFLYGAE